MSLFANQLARIDSCRGTVNTSSRDLLYPSVDVSPAGGFALSDSGVVDWAFEQTGSSAPATATTGEHNASSTRHAVGVTAEIDALRIVQDVGGGREATPNRLWLTQIKANTDG